MKKISLLMVLLVLSSCGVSTVKNSEKSALFDVLTQQSEGGANIRFFEILTEANEIKMLQNDDKLKNKIKSEDIQKSNFIILNMGEKPTSGFKIGVESVLETDKNIIVAVKESSPESDTMVSQEITNPYCVVRINSKKEIIIK